MALRTMAARRAAALVAAAAVAGLVAAGCGRASAASGGRAAPGTTGPGNTAFPTATATVTRQLLTSQTQVSATLGDAGSYSVVNQAQGTITELPAVGQVVRQGQALYELAGSPVVLLQGTVPAYRDLAEGTAGPDVAELNADLVQLGYATKAELGSGPDYFSAATAAALEELQTKLGLPVTGTLPLGQAVFLPVSAAVITGQGSGVVAGGQAAPGSVLLTASSTTPAVTIDLDASQQTEVRNGDHVTITLPDGALTPGVISHVGGVLTPAPSSSSSGTNGPGNSGTGPSGSSSGPTITVVVTLSDPGVAAGLNQAPVQVGFTTASAANALAVPVDALVAQSNGSYEVEVTNGRADHWITVTPGVFDDAKGLVQVTASGLSAGEHVVVPVSPTDGG
jgi:Putative peptidoglycan binding domain